MNEQEQEHGTGGTPLEGSGTPPTGAGAGDSAGTPPEGTPGTTEQQLSHEDALKALAEVRKEAAASRVKLKELQDAQAAEAEKKRQAELTAEQRAAEAVKAAEAKAAEAEARAVAAERRAQLTGKVADADAALKLLDPEKHVKDDNVDLDALLADFPFLKATPDAKPGPAPVPGGGAPNSGASSMNALIRQKAGRG